MPRLKLLIVIIDRQLETQTRTGVSVKTVELLDGLHKSNYSKTAFYQCKAVGMYDHFCDSYVMMM